jgi:coenzyme PQQ biosynthesis protein PqqD
VSRPKLAAKARLRWDRREGKDILLYPERGLLLNPVAGAIVRLCDGSRTAEDITREVAASFPATAPEEVARDVAEFLEELRARGLLEGAS